MERKNNREILLEFIWHLNEKEILEVIDYCDRFMDRKRKVAEGKPDGMAIMEIQENGIPEFQGWNHRKSGSITS
jgi:hypothetical protein